MPHAAVLSPDGSVPYCDPTTGQVVGEGMRHVYTIAPGGSFTDFLAAGLLEHYGKDGALAQVLVLLPNRRSIAAVREAFLRRAGGKPLLLPRLRPIGDVDEDEILLSDQPLMPEALLSPALSKEKRELLLTRLVAAKSPSLQPAAALRFARDLAGLLDELTVQGVAPEALETLVPDPYAAHWQETLAFLRIVTAEWPKILATLGEADPAARRRELMFDLAKRWAAAPPPHPIIAAGSTGSQPPTAALLKTIAQLPQGAVVLPGLDQACDDETWQAVGAEPVHPQFGLFQLLAGLGMDRAEVAPWPGSPPETLRARLFHDALAPGSQTGRWAEARAKGEAQGLATALDGVTQITAPTPTVEAQTIALALREVLETPGQRGVLITPDRNLARRVTAELKRYGIDINDSAGRPLADTAAGSFLILLADAIGNHLAPVPLLALIKHPLAAGGLAGGTFRGLARRFDRRLARGPRPAPGLDGWRAKLAQAAKDRDQEPDGTLSGFLDQLGRFFAPLTAFEPNKAINFAELAAALLDCAEALAADDQQEGAARLFAGEAGEALARLFQALFDAKAVAPGICPADLPAFLRTLMEGAVVRPHAGRHPRLAIWGPLEARLQQADVAILAGLNEGTWPRDPGADPWLSRPMRAALGLDSPERRIGMSAHDFVMAAGAPRLILSRSLKNEGTPTVPSRWLLRLETLTGRKIPAEPLMIHAGFQDRVAEWRPAAAPAPRPPPAARPRELPVTDIEKLIRDPYAIYAKRILGLRPLDPVDADPGAGDRGTIIHDALAEFIAARMTDKRVAAADLIAIGEKLFAERLGSMPAVAVLWWPRFLRVAHWFADYENSRRAAGTFPALIEEAGATMLGLKAGLFKLTARADRIDRMADGRYAVLDYKTGQAPSKGQVEAGFAPQLTLESVILAAGGFASLGKGEAGALTYIRLSGGMPPGEEKPLKLDVPAETDKARAEAAKLLKSYELGETPYLSRPRPQFLKDAGDYDHLARLAEWAGSGEGE